MTERIKTLKEMFVEQRVQRKVRQPAADPYALAERWSKAGYSDLQRAQLRLAWVLEQERPVVFLEERIALVRTVPVLPELFTQKEWEKIRTHCYIHEQGKVCNVTPDYTLLLNRGFDAVLRELEERQGALPPEGEQHGYLQVLRETLETVQAFADRYRQEAERVGNKTVAQTFSRVPRQPPRSFLEALQFLRLLHYCLWASFQYHNTMGRFDQYLWPYLRRDLEKGMTEQEALELVEEFFLTCNRDSDLYPGMQQGDNGQSLVLGGRNPDGTDSYNLLSDLCLTACGELRLIDPKINLRVHRGTPVSTLEKGTRLTKLGLGFPQYANDDVIIPCLLHWGYEEADAFNYSVAACWELIIPGRGMDIPNIDALSFPKVVLDCLPDMEQCTAFSQAMELVRDGIRRETERMIGRIGPVYMEPAPFLSLMMEGCVQRGADISLGGRYNNYGFHGAGLATAVDSLAAIRRCVFEEKRMTVPRLEKMLKENFQGYERELVKLRCSEEKMGNDLDEVDEIGVQLLDWFADALEGKRNSRGGIFRPGTGSAMYYLWYGDQLGATPDGRRAGEGLPCNYSPSLFVRTRGPISVFKSFAKPHLERVANGGPLTIELHDSVFRSEESIRKVAGLIQTYLRLGGHQLQINAVNREVLQDAKEHPEHHKNLIVRVWGWSGYFVELEEAYQDHIIRRAEMLL